MSVHHVPLPSPPPDTLPPGPMSGLFMRSVQAHTTSDGIPDAANSELEAGARKRVEFHPWTTNIAEAHLSTPDSEVPPSLKSLPPSRDCQLSSRPILKTAQSTEALVLLDGRSENTTVLEKMDSLLQNLSRNDRSSSVDAYQTMTSLIKTYDEPPEQEILQMKMAQLQSHIKRDLVILDKSADSLPSEERLGMGNLVMSALKVLVTMVWSPVYSPCLTDSFRQWAIDRSIQVLKERTAPKAVLLHYMHLLATQNFTTRLMSSSNRISRIIEVLHELSDHISGKAVIAERLLVYQKLIDQGKSMMEKRVDLWMKNLLSAMAHSFKEVRSNAISAGTKACIAFASSTSIAVAARQSLAEITSERSLSTSMTNRLERVLAAKDEANQIPQIWTIVLMLCNGKHDKLDSWPQLHEWLKLVQRCFNCSDSTVRVQAFMAWNRLYYVAKPHEASDKVVSMLAKPAMNQLDKTGNNVSGKGTRQAVISSYCMLLYYAFRPSSSPQQYTRMWNEFVVKLMTRSFLAKSSANCDLSCRVLAALFHNSLSTTRVWNENRAHENAPLDPLELPAVDSKWIRAHIASILSILELLVEYSSFGPNGVVSEQSYIAQTWRHLMKAIRESSSKEVVANADSRSALQSILDFLGSHSLSHDETSTDPVDDQQIGLLARLTIAELGSSTILQALENTPGFRINIVLYELMFVLLTPISDLDNHPSRQKPSYEKCLDILKDDLSRLSQMSSSMGSDQRNIVVQMACQCLKTVPAPRVLQALLSLQDCATSIIKGFDKKHLNGETSTADQASHQVFCTALSQVLNVLQASDYKKVDVLLSALISTNDSKVRDAFLATRSRHFWTMERALFGPSLTQAIAAIPHLASPTHLELQQHSEAKSGLRSSMSTKIKHQPLQAKPRHDDSQVDFVPVASSPLEYEALDSQLLTTRQKEVRQRQNAERTLTFADIRSSPSTKRSKSGSSEGRNVRSASPKLQTTPVLPRQRSQYDNEQPPTPTPRTRRSLRNQLQPEIPSSPPSVVGGDATASKATVITSSPVKEVNYADGAVRLDVIEDDTIHVNGEVHDPVMIENVHVHLLQSHRDTRRLEYPQLPTSDVQGAEPTSSGERYETAEIEVSTPESYSDEYDALAASQLSQSLVEESHSAAVYTESQNNTSTKRKRSGEHNTTDSHQKRRKSSEAHETKNPELQTEEMEDCIVVNTESSYNRLNTRRSRSSQQATSRRKSKLGSPAHSQTSQKSIPSTPSSQHSTSKRKKRSNRKTRSQSSQDASPMKQIPSIQETENDIEHTVSDIVIEVGQDTSLPETTSLSSEVNETNDDEPIVSSPQMQSLHDTNHVLADGDKVEDAIENGSMILFQQAHNISKNHTSADIPGQLSEDQQIAFDVVKSLQGILENLDHTSAADGQKLDLSTIHSLCFQIGLKVQHLAHQ